MAAAVAQVWVEILSASNNRADQLNNIAAVMQNIATNAPSAAAPYRSIDRITENWAGYETLEMARQSSWYEHWCPYDGHVDECEVEPAAWKLRIRPRNDPTQRERERWRRRRRGRRGTF